MFFQKNFKTSIFLIGSLLIFSSCSFLPKRADHPHSEPSSYHDKKICSHCGKKSCSHKDKKTCPHHGKKFCPHCSKKSCSHRDKKTCPCKSSKFHKKNKVGNVIFIHPDGMSLSHWDAVRLVKAGFNGYLNFDFMPYMAVYRGTIRDQIAATSNAGGTIHAFGIKTGKDSFGMDEGKKILSSSKESHSILISAKKRGLSVALCQSGVLVEPGTAVFAAQVNSRKNKDEIAKQIIEADLDLVFGGGEKYLLPEGVQGHFGLGARKDNLNLIDEAKKKGYAVIYNLKQFKKLPKDTQKILGVFAHEDTYNDETEEVLRQKKLDHYQKNAPTIAEMTQTALEFLKRKNKQFFLVVEEEGTDNFSNKNNIFGFLKSAGRADDALGVGRDFLEENPNTLLLTTSDSNASGLIITNPPKKDKLNADKNLKNILLTSKYNSKSKSDFLKIFPKHFYRKNSWGSSNTSYSFSVVWASPEDVHGSVVVKAEGLNSHKIKGVIENTQIYDIIYSTLFGKNPSGKGNRPF